MAEESTRKLNKILLVPTTDPQLGMGHWMRTLELAQYLGARCTVLVPSDRPDLVRQFQERGLPESGANLVHGTQGFTWPVVVLDQMKSSLAQVQRFRDCSDLLVGLDEGGGQRSSFPFLIDTINRPERHAANHPIPWSGLGSVRPLARQNQVRILLSFGAADKQQLTLAVLEKLKVQWNKGVAHPDSGMAVHWGIVKGTHFGYNLGPEILQGLPGTAEILDSPRELKKLMVQWDSFLGSFGLAAQEAREQGLDCLLVNPSPYHDKVARHQGFRTLALGKVGMKAVWKLLGPSSRRERVGDSSKVRLFQGLGTDGTPGYNESPATGPEALARFLVSLQPRGLQTCPACAHPGKKALYRDKNRTLLECSHCRLVFLVEPGVPAPVYDHDYFFQEYRKQYGRSYLEDFSHIRTMARPRLARIDQYQGARQSSKGKTLLDVGCAYGPFLVEARELGWQVYGLEPHGEAVEYLAREWGIQAQTGFLESFQPFADGAGRFDVVSLWYVIEHFPQLGTALGRIHKLLNPGGLLALSTPHGRGVSRLFRPKTFFSQSPRDHYSIWDRGSARRLLAHWGFQVLGFRITGHHPERFGPLGRWTLTRPLAMAFSHLLGLGDTFEIYARQVPVPKGTTDGN